MNENKQPQTTLTTTLHDRDFYGSESLIYPVLSRRVKGISVGINTSISKACNFGCAYCEVDRTKKGSFIKFNVPEADSQLRKVLTDIQEGKGGFGNEKIKAITLSGDGEPSSLTNFNELIEKIVTTTH